MGKLWTEFVDPLLAKFGLTKTELWMLVVVALTVAAAKGWIDPSWVEWVKQHPFESLLAAFMPAGYFEQLRTKGLRGKV